MLCQQKLNNSVFSQTRRLLISVAVLPIRFYRYAISPLLGSNCRFYPSCSSYSIESIESHGLLKGGYFSIKRILKCHPWHPGGVDPVPDLCAAGCTKSSNHQHSGSIT